MPRANRPAFQKTLVSLATFLFLAGAGASHSATVIEQGSNGGDSGESLQDAVLGGASHPNYNRSSGGSVGTGGTVGGQCSSPPLATPQNISRAQGNIIGAVNNVGDYVGETTQWMTETISETIWETSDLERDQIRAHTETMVTSMDSLFEQQNALIRDLMVEFGSAQARHQLEQDLGPQSHATSARNCSMASNISRGIADTRAEIIGYEMTESSQLRNRTQNFSSDALNEILAAEMDENGNTFYNRPIIDHPMGSIPPEEIEKAQRKANAALNPEPPPNVPEESLDTPQGKEYERTRRVREAQLSLTESTMSNYIADRSATTEVPDMVYDTWEQIGGDANELPRGVVETEDGDHRISRDMMRWYETAQYTQDPDWSRRINTEMNRTGIMAEQAEMKRVQLMYEEEKLRWIQRVAALLATQTAMKINEGHKDQLEMQRSQAMEQVSRMGVDVEGDFEE